MACRTKYGNRKITKDGMTFDSITEYRRFLELSLLERAGAIQGLKRQVRYTLIPSQKISGKVVERPVVYIADFTYYDKDGKLHVEDVKGFRTDVFKIKKKLMLYIHGIQVTEV